jgi:hypothetical protein
MDPIKIKLQYPIAFGSETIDSVEISRRIKVKDVQATAGKTDVEASIILGYRLTGLSPATFAELDAVDFAAVSDAIAPFLPSGLTDGKTE